MSTAVQIDLGDGVEPSNEFSFGTIEPGMYDAKVDKAEFKIAESGDKSPMAVLTWKIVGGPNDGRKVRFNNIIFHPKMARIVKGVFLATGLKPPTKPVSAEALAKAFARDVVGKLARITVANGEPNKNTGKIFPEVVAVYPADLPGASPSDSDSEDLPSL